MRYPLHCSVAVLPAVGAGSLTLPPNPAQGRVTPALAAPLPASAVARVLDAWGREARRQALPARATTAVLAVAGLPTGLYWVRSGQGTAQLVVE